MSAQRAAHETAIHALVSAARAGDDPRVVARMSSGWAMFGERQFLRGYLLLLPDPVVASLNSLRDAARAQFMLDMAQLGDALLKATGALRINYAIFGNLEPALHAHIVPRYADEPAHLATQQPWAYDWSCAPVFDPQASGQLAAVLRRELASAG